MGAVYCCPHLCNKKDKNNMTYLAHRNKPEVLIPGNGFGLGLNNRILEWESKTELKFMTGSNALSLKIGDRWFMPTSDITFSISSALDTGSIAAGTDYYVYACNENGSLFMKVSTASTYPSGFTASTSRKIGGFHTLCTNVGTISGHTLTGYEANDILPLSVWDLKHRPVSDPGGMVYCEAINKWVDIYLPSLSAGDLVSANGGTIVDGASNPDYHWYNFVEQFGAVKKTLMQQSEFMMAALNSNEETNINGSSDPGTTGGHSDTGSRRMISNIGCEDMAGAMYQWGLDTAADDFTAGWAVADTAGDGTTYDGANSVGRGQGYEVPDRVLFGGYWDDGAYCGSRCAKFSNAPLYLGSGVSGRGASEPA